MRRSSGCGLQRRMAPTRDWGLLELSNARRRQKRETVLGFPVPVCLVLVWIFGEGGRWMGFLK
jgi:hypothetical protein